MLAGRPRAVWFSNAGKQVPSPAACVNIFNLNSVKRRSQLKLCSFKMILNLGKPAKGQIDADLCASGAEGLGTSAFCNKTGVAFSKQIDLLSLQFSLVYQ